MKPLPRDFYARPTLLVARDLIGRRLVHDTPAGRAAGLIVEVEAYIGEADPACHAAAGRTRRTAPLYGEPGFAYVYLNYGMHHLVNAVTEPRDAPAAVLIRALEPVEGLELMRARRGYGNRLAPSANDLSLCRGPGNLTRALGITLAQNGADLCRSRLSIEEGEPMFPEIAWGPRIGISVGTESPWRCYVAGHGGVSAGTGGMGARRRKKEEGRKSE